MTAAMPIVAGKPNYVNDTMVLGMSDLRRLRQERPMLLTGGRGVHVTDEDGREYIEAVSSFYCVALGYSNAELIDAAMDQMQKLPMYPSGMHRTLPVVLDLAEKLAAISPIPGTRVAFATTGSEANDSLMKFMWYTNTHAGEPKRRRVITRAGSYHGSTALLTGFGGSEGLHRSFGIDTSDCLYVSHPAWPEGAATGEDEAAYTARLAAELRTTIEAAGPETIGAFLAEPMSVSAGMRLPPAGYFQAVQSVLTEYGIAMFADEVVTGFGRTGQMWGSQTLGIRPDCVTTAKGLSSAYQPISAILMSPQFYDRLERASDDDGWFAHGGTYHAHPVAAAVALKTIEIFERDDIVGHVQGIMPAWRRALESLTGHPLVASIRCFGLAGAVEFRSDAAATPARSLKVSGLPKLVYEAGIAAGVLLRPVGNCIVMAPPLIITEAEIAELTRRLRTALDAVLAASPPT
jgi:4-aminobutyrate--pyruvate transaminase